MCSRAQPILEILEMRLDMGPCADQLVLQMEWKWNVIHISSICFNVKCSRPLQGVVYMDESVLGWRPLAEAWLANRSPQESHVSFHLCEKVFS